MQVDGVVVIGAGGHGKVVVATLQAAGVKVAGIYDDDPGRLGDEVLGVPVVGAARELGTATGRPAVLAVGDNRARQRLAAELPLAWVSVVHPSAVVHPSVRLGPGSVVFAGAVVQPDTEIGAHAIVNTGSRIDHDCRIGDFVHVAPGVNLAGGVVIEDGSFIGIGSCAVPGVRVGAWATVGAGAAVVRDVREGTTVVGVPARELAR